MSQRYREVDVSGPPRELGRQIGEAAREETRGFCEVALERVNKTVSISMDRALDIARRSTQFAEQYRPDLVEELRGTAESAGVTLDDLMLLQVRNQFTPEHGGCTSLAMQSSAPGRTVVAQTWDNDPLLDEFTIVLTRRPDGRPATRWMTPTQVRGRQGYLHAVTSPNFRKVQHIANEKRVEWMFQTPDLNRIVTVKGEISMVDNPQLKSEVLEAIGRRLEVFWRVNRQQEFLVLETRIEEIKLFRPMKQERHGVQLGGES